MTEVFKNIDIFFSLVFGHVITADHILIFFYFSEKIRLGISYELSAAYDSHEMPSFISYEN